MLSLFSSCFIGEETKRTFIKPHYPSKAGFLTFGTLDILGLITVSYGVSYAL